MSDRPTLKSLGDELLRLKKELDSSKTTPPRTEEDREARAICRAVEALDALPKSDQRQSGYASLGYASYAFGISTAHERVLDYLRQRYGLPNPRDEVTRLRQELAEVVAERDQLRSHLNGLRDAVTTPTMTARGVL